MYNVPVGRQNHDEIQPFEDSIQDSRWRPGESLNPFFLPRADYFAVFLALIR
jgi:hypothetical protein